MKMRLLLLSAFLTTILLLPYRTSGQEIFPQTNMNETSQVETDSVAPQPFPIMGITREFGATNRLVAEAEDSHISQEDIDKFSTELDSLVSGINEFLSDSTLWSLENLSSRELDQIAQQDQFYLNQNEDLMNRLTKIAGELENQSKLLQVNRQRWQLTLNQDVDDETLEARSERIKTTIQSIQTVENLLQNDLLFIIDAQDKLSASKTELETLMSGLRDQKLALGEALLKRDVPGFFKDLSNL